MEERLQKIIAARGAGSRRQAEAWIREGRVTVNGVRVTKLGSKADPARDEIRLDGRLLGFVGDPVYLMLHKPEGYITSTRDPEGRPTVMQLVKKVRQRVYPVGRLDFNSSGLLLLTSDGGLARFLSHPSSEIPKTYYVKVTGRVTPRQLEKLARGPEIGGPPLKAARVRFLKTTPGARHSWLEITIHEGRNRQIRRMCEAVGHEVLKLKRVALGPLQLGDLPLGQYRELSASELAALKRLMKKSPPNLRPPPPGLRPFPEEGGFFLRPRQKSGVCRKEGRDGESRRRRGRDRGPAGR